MYDRLYLLLDNGQYEYTRDFTRLFCDDVVEVIKHERTFDNGQTFIEV